MKLELIKIQNPENLNLILGQSHFIKTVEDMHEALISAVPGIRFGLAFSEASGSRLIRKTGTELSLIKLAAENLKKLGCGHSFIIFLKETFPINVLPAIRNLSETVNIFAATANPLEVIIARSNQGGGILGVIDGQPPQRIETSRDEKDRYDFLRKIGYKLK